MNRDTISERREEITYRLELLNREIAALRAELDDLAAAERVIDRHEGKAVEVGPSFDEVLRTRAAAPTTTISFTDFFHNFVDAKVAGKSSTGGALLRALANMDTSDIPPLDRPQLSTLADLYDEIVPEQKATLPDQISAAMWVLAMRGEHKVTPRRVEEIVQEAVGAPLTQNVNSVMWRMMKQGTLEKDPNGPHYWLPGMIKPQPPEQDATDGAVSPGGDQ